MLELDQRVAQRFHTALHVGADQQRDHQLLVLAHIVEQVLQVGRLLLGQASLALAVLTLRGRFAGLALIGGHQHFVAGQRHTGQAQHLHRHGRAHAVHLLAQLIEHGAHAAIFLAGQHHVTLVQGTFLHQHRGQRAAALVEARFDHHATRAAVHWRP